MIENENMWSHHCAPSPALFDIQMHYTDPQGSQLTPHGKLQAEQVDDLNTYRHKSSKHDLAVFIKYIYTLTYTQLIYKTMYRTNGNNHLGRHTPSTNVQAEL
jgi:hypothetical protein